MIKSPSGKIYLLIVLLPFVVFADAPLHDAHNRYTGKKTILSLTKDQMTFLNARTVHWFEIKIANPYERWQSTLLKLTPTQIEAIEQAGGISPTRLELWDTRKGQWDCSCQSANLAFRFSEDQIEVPDEFLMTDDKANKIWIEFCDSF